MSREIWEEKPDLVPGRSGGEEGVAEDHTEAKGGGVGAWEEGRENLAEGAGEDKASKSSDHSAPSSHKVQENMHLYTRIHEMNK